jgi:hypothetical protein
MSICDFTSSEISAGWYNQEDMDRITKRCLKVLRKMESRESNKGEKYYMKGLEGHTALGSISKKKNRAAAIAAVMQMEQSKQWIENKTDDQAIADAYRSTTYSGQMWAQVVGKRNEEAAEASYHIKVERHDAPSFKCTKPDLSSFEQRRMHALPRSSIIHILPTAVAA